MGRGNTYEFKFVLTGVELSDENVKEISNAVALAGSSSLALLKPTQELSKIEFLPREWYGLIIHPISELDHEQQFADLAGVRELLQR